MKIELANIQINTILEDNFSEVQQIYLQGLETGNASFETSVPDWNKWNKQHCLHSRISVSIDNKMIGWAALSPVSERCVYDGVSEISVYVHKDFRDQGVGTILLKRLIDESESNGIWSLMSGVFPENKTSIKLHLNEGFRIVGTREKIAKMNNVWRDTLLLQRRSTKIGID